MFDKNLNVDRGGWKKSVIINVIKDKINDWVKSIDDVDLVTKIRGSYIVTGGAIASMLCGNKPNDFDIYFDDPAVALKVAEYYISKVEGDASGKAPIIVIGSEHRVEIKVKSVGVIRGEEDKREDYDYFEITDNTEGVSVADSYLSKKFNKKENYSVAMITSNAISLHNDIQIITRFIGDAAAIHKNFDFIHCSNYYTEATGLVLNQNALEAIVTRTLVYSGSLYPICSIFRIRKFIERGWTITAGQILKIVWDVNDLDLTSVDVLQDQLTGVDAAYMDELISIIKKEKPKDIDKAYISNLIDRVFEHTD